MPDPILPDSAGMPVLKPVSDAVAFEGVQAFVQRASGSAFDSNLGLLFDPHGLKRYLSDIMPGIIARHEEHMRSGGVEKPTGALWGLSFAYKYGLADHREGLGFYVVPMLYVPGEAVFDYFKQENDPYYYRPASGQSANVYNEGQVWP